MTLEITLGNLDQIYDRLNTMLEDYVESEVRIENTTTYAPFVGKRTRQAAIHRNRWISDRESIDAEIRVGFTGYNSETLLSLAERIVDRLQSEPAPLPTYRRTGLYKRNFVITRTR